MKGKRVFITGGAAGIGRAIVEAFTKAGAIVAFCDNDREKCIETTKNTGAQFFHLDVSDATLLEATVTSLFDEWGDIDIIVNNVGVGNFKPLLDCSVEDFDKTLAINLRPVFITSRLLAIHRSKQATSNPYGRIVNISSTRYLMSEPNTEAYAASKGGISSLTHALAMSLAKYRITVNSVSPGWIQNENYESLSERDHSQHPSGRVGKPEDIARTVMFLCGTENDFINAQNIVVDGGMTRKMIYEE